MAVLVGNALQQMRQRISAERATIGHTKTQVNAALQACEDYFEGTARSGFGAAIETAVPTVFPTAVKKVIVRAWLIYKFFAEV